MWSKRPKPNGKGLRCKVHVQIRNGLEPCDRPAKRYGQQVKPYWSNGELQDVGIIDCCKGHAEKIRSQGVTLTRIDRRYTANPPIRETY